MRQQGSQHALQTFPARAQWILGLYSDFAHHANKHNSWDQLPTTTIPYGTHVLPITRHGSAPNPARPCADPSSSAAPNQPGESWDPPSQNSLFSLLLILINNRTLQENPYWDGQALATVPCFIFLLLTKAVASNVRQQEWTDFVQSAATSYMNNIWAILEQPRSQLSYSVYSLSLYLIVIFVGLGVDARKTRQDSWHFCFLMVIGKFLSGSFSVRTAVRLISSRIVIQKSRLVISPKKQTSCLFWANRSLQY